MLFPESQELAMKIAKTVVREVLLDLQCAKLESKTASV